ncbi:helix-turn-helix domain-containing protein [Magnetovibrio sp.]|uniref:helix-turn-helix domain-containing protein n=1 Tax=Magnetovibrio sp. TaxID=2024836 RepID=UPI002F95324C
MTDSQSTSSNAAADSAAPAAVGGLLRQSRENAGLNIADAARALRISQKYLEALEDGRHADLPGTPYAIGFVRSYAEHLHLDSNEIVRRYKDEAAGAGGKNDLVFPKPIVDGGVPGGAVLGLGVMVAAVAYGVWYWNSNKAEVEVARVEAVPEYMAGSEQAAGSKPAAEAMPAPETTPETMPETEVQATAEEQVAEPVTAADEVVSSSGPLADAPAVEAPVQEEGGGATSSADTAHETAVSAVETPAPVTEAPEPVTEPVTQQDAPERGAAQVVEQAAEQPDEPSVAPTVEQPAEPVSEPDAETVAEAATQDEPTAQAEAQPQTEAAAVAAVAPTVAAQRPDDGPSRITVRAKSNSWIQVRDEIADRLLFTRLLREGQEYQVPNRPGLRLMTGNAGALELLVDGQAVPAIGEVGEVRRNVDLDVDKLQSGSAVTE